MYTRELVKQIWREAGLYDSRKAKVRAFLKHLDDHPEHCWDECAAMFRQQYYDIFKDLVPPLLGSKDKLLRQNVINRLNPRERRELNLLKTFVRHADPKSDEAALVTVAKLEHKGLTSELSKKSDLTGKVRRLVQTPKPSRTSSKKSTKKGRKNE